MKILLSILLLYFSFGLYAQNQKDYSQIDSIINNIPEEWTSSTEKLAQYINAQFTEESDKARAAYTWIATNIVYDVDNMLVLNSYQQEEEMIEEAMRTRKGICGHYAEIFNDVAHQIGLKSYSISGYTKQNDVVDYLSHGWCVARIDSAWYVFDPTWGAGVLVGTRFVQRLNDQFFMMKPDHAIVSHMPFDPMWQFLNYPITSTEFYKDDFVEDSSKTFFNYTDTLKQYEQQSELEQLVASTSRIEQNGVENTLISNRLRYNRQLIENNQKQAIIDNYNDAIDAYNKGVFTLNNFINYRNQQFRPQKTESEIREMVENINQSLTTAKQKLAEIKKPYPEIANSIIQLNEAIDQAMKEQGVHQAFVDKYFSTKKIFRKSLFYKHTWMGIPLN